MNKVFSVVRVERCKASFVRMKQFDGQAILTSHQFEDIESMRVPAELSISEEIEDKEKVFTSELNFQCCHEIGHAGTWAYRITLADGTRYVMGSSERPFPITSMSRTMGAVNSSQVPSYNILFKSNKPLPIQG